jgi:FlaA1/EpsC-like NDP-sugar epimerase
MPSWKHLLSDAVLLLASLYASLWLRTGVDGLDQHLHTLNTLAAFFVIIRLACFTGFGVYRSMWRYISTNDATRLGMAVALSVPLNISLTFFSSSFGTLPRSFFIIDALVATALLMGMRLGRRRLFERQMRPKKGSVTIGKMIIFGAGQNGRLLAQRLLSDPSRDRDLLGFIDDDPHKYGKLIQGLPVLGRADQLEEILVRSGCTDLVVAVTHPPAELMREIVVVGRKTKVRVMRIAHFDAPSIARSEALYQPVELKDLLNRPSAAVDLPSLKGLISGRVVLVTGAGGSIGSELSRQIARLGPAKLLLLDHSELNLFEIDSELRPRTDDFSTVAPLLCDIKDERTLEQVFQKYKPQVVFHAAAYKHVHLVEANVASAVQNNVAGTWNLLKLSEAFNVERFVLISSDKAVNPVGAMGATKRVCELLTSQVGLKLKKPYSSVRFGNVLGSSGSLIPTLEKQIRDGGPLTLTHPDMTRYFMLIPEAVSLVLMSATLSQPGDINVLKMGEPVRIQDLARNLIAMMGRSESEIAIAYTGVRPGEKMYEELYLTGNELATRHGDILTVPRGDGLRVEIVAEVERLLALASSADPGLTAQLIRLANSKAPAGATVTIS